MMNSKADIQDWNRNATIYSETIENQGDGCYPEVRERFWELLGDVRGVNVLDLGCGQGWLSKKLSDRGAFVVGVDGSSQLVDRARTLYPDVEFHVFDLAGGLPELNLKFEIVVSHMVVMDISEIDSLFSAVSQVLKPWGKFIFTLPHPCFFNWKSHQDESGQWFKKVKGYLTPEIWRISSFGGHNHYHRALSEYVRTLRQAGLMVSSLDEPCHQPKSDRIDPDFLKTMPVFLLVEAIKAEP